MNATPRLMGAVRPFPLRSLGALLALALFAVGLFSLAQTPAAHAASEATTVKPQTALRTARRGVDLSEAAARRGAARRASKSGRPTAHAAMVSPPELIFEIWGLRVLVDREVACFLAEDHPWGYAALDAIPPPWNVVATVAVKAYKWLLVQQMGSQGVEMHFNWMTGTLHWIEPRGEPQPCNSIPTPAPEPELTTVPGVIGTTPTEAREVLRTAGFAVSVEAKDDPTCENLGTVISQSPAAGTGLAKGSTVTITVGRKPKPPRSCP